MRLWLEQLNDLEVWVCRVAARPVQYRGVQRGFAWVSRLGDGVLWYSLIAILPLADGLDGLQAGLHMLVTGALALLLYKSLKGATRRQRPCHRDTQVAALVPPLDHFSFPSGHTLHACSFSSVAVAHYPELAWVLVPFSLLVAISRVILGLHYPSDVLAAMALGLGLGYAAILPLG